MIHKHIRNHLLLMLCLTLAISMIACEDKEPPAPPLPRSVQKTPKQQSKPVVRARKTVPKRRNPKAPQKVVRGKDPNKPKLSGKQRHLARSMAHRVGGKNRRVKPVYYDPKFKANPLAVQLCHDMHELPAKRKATCCKKKGVGYTATKECIRNLSIALKYGTVKLKPKQAKS